MNGRNDGDRRGRPARPDRRDGRTGDADRSGGGKASAESAILATLKELEKPLSAGDFDAQKKLLEGIRERVLPLRLTGIEQMEFDCRTRLFTSLLRAGRQPVVEDAEREQKRKDMLFALGQLWQALADERRAAVSFAAAGRTEPALKLLQKAGEWEEMAALHEREGRPREAAQLYEKNRAFAQAARAFEAAGDGRGWLRTALLEGDMPSARRAAATVPLATARELLLRQGHGDELLDLLAGQGRWEDVAHLYERAEQWSDAAMAWERARRAMKAAELFRRAGEEASALRLIEAEAHARREKGDLVGAGQVFVRFELPRQAAELVREKRPDLAFKWLQQGGQDGEALELARREAQTATEQGRQHDAGLWLERLGEHARAAEAYERAGHHLDALRLFEQLAEWEKAAEAAARAGQGERALALLRRAGVADPEGRLARLDLPPA